MDFSHLSIFKTKKTKKRVGSHGDGGYVISTDINYDIMISGGISNNIDFEIEFLEMNKNLICHAFDGTIKNLPVSHERIKFHKKNISGFNNDIFTNLVDLISAHKNIFLKLDIEAYEFNWLHNLPENLLNNISQIVIEFHYPYTDYYFFDGSESLPISDKIEVLKKINKTHKLIHLNPNNTCGTIHLNGINLPNVFECTYLRRDICDLNEISDEPIPTSLDNPNSDEFPIIKLDYYPFIKGAEIKKSIVIIDSFVSDKKIESDLIKQVERVKKNNLDILLISNTKVSSEILEKVDFFIFDKRNQLFQDTYTNINDVIFSESIFQDDKYQFTINRVTPGLQRHGLSVLVNLFNSVNLAKSLGYQNFWRIEVDDLFGEKSLDFLKQSPRMLEESVKKALLYYNPDNISFHFMFWNIDYFLEKIPQIRNEEDYRNLITKKFGSLDFVIAEEFIWKFLKINGDVDVLIKDGQNMDADFPDTVWNTNMSLSNLSPKYEMCTSSLFRMNSKDGLFLFSKNYSNDEKSRKIIIHYPSKQEVINHNLTGFNTWCWNIVNENPYKYEVYEGDRLLFVEDCKEIKNYVEFP
jgi:hypothetical protein